MDRKIVNSTLSLWSSITLQLASTTESDYRFIYEEDIVLLMYPSRWRSVSFATFHNRVGKDVFGALKDGPEPSYLKVASPRHLILRPEKAESVLPLGRNLQ
ncbi:uncharacterized protein C8R40DRAFT_1173836 [Lentinula edodes]|uniref:uncharacterized protein n=1 Tax=Lentinula edodes TaxID=5353 RepID=UPI001E8E1D19|nr:uncharacterized protein C8R40DRAFT_1173836 [Lentinula edodes]KAH7872098.1 hypothetical protein C8R40DRAFT_1173836 [Lentinula edodes]KAJ3921312.1 hypothetical protein F5877DRAFT_76371 [Lentinula edodes]